MEVTRASSFLTCRTSSKYCRFKSALNASARSLRIHSRRRSSSSTAISSSSSSTSSADAPPLWSTASYLVLTTATRIAVHRVAICRVFRATATHSLPGCTQKIIVTRPDLKDACSTQFRHDCRRSESSSCPKDSFTSMRFSWDKDWLIARASSFPASVGLLFSRSLPARSTRVRTPSETTPCRWVRAISCTTAWVREEVALYSEDPIARHRRALTRT
mmetsp:Transcript_12863/g.30868  ORF Transcript_12863/g.30868 Transcript_12863/m.30868 type:complete len:217 (-) Transcript_12863:218-868(-)